ncbi:DUF423 domain-containing protein [Aestuariibaculum sediminum]|uniref:DUF423 domain-containing protein n=1 Tax=Aestuariibaculum sediminum TaxID=2770637 RepID=A0A8J6Q1A8_9FLAO|nr:DUF423 domain-containing protein [Aestuariibaculum sediminum]MBD0830944.1 DUF423 domain-containing protein [Aestuariibaculum sediminum]
MNKQLMVVGAVLGVTSVLLGAFGAHGLKTLIPADAINIFETGVRYQMYHALFLMVVGLIPLMANKSKKIILYLVLAGVILFSGSIYGLATNTLTSFDFKNIGFITPIGGLFLIVSWVYLIVNIIKYKS